MSDQIGVVAELVVGVEVDAELPSGGLRRGDGRRCGGPGGAGCAGPPVPQTVEQPVLCAFGSMREAGAVVTGII